MDGPDLRAQYLAQLRGEPAATATPRQPISLAELMTLQGHAAGLGRQAPKPHLDEQQRAKTELRRSPLLTDLLELCAQGLGGARPLAQRLGATPALCDHIVAQEREVGKVIKASGDLYTLASAAADETAAAAQTLGEQALRAAHRFASDPQQERARRSAVELSFAEPFRLYEEIETRAARAQRRTERRLRPLLMARDQARGAAQELRLLERFLARHKSET